MSEYIGKKKMNMTIVKDRLKPWTDKNGKVRYYVNEFEYILTNYRRATGFSRSSYYDWSEMRASSGRVAEIIEGNVLSKTKVYIDGKGRVHVCGYGAGGVALDYNIPQQIEKAINREFGYCTKTERQKSKEKLVGKGGDEARVGDTVKIVAGRKEVGKVFTVAKVSEYYYSQYRSPSVYLYAKDGFKVNADNTKIIGVGYSCL